jgi:hypothetical protein
MTRLQVIKAAAFNGWVDFIDTSNGRPARACIVSLQASKQEFETINIDAINPKACFCALKGVGSAKLAQMAPVVSIVRMDRSDERFMQAREVITAVDNEFHGLRHTWASLAVMAGMPLLVVAKNLGHSNTRMAEKHYGHLAPSYVAETTRQYAPRFGITTPSNVTPLKTKATAHS